MSIQVLQEFYGNVKVTKPLAAEVPAQLIADLAAWQAHRPGVEDTLDVTRLQDRYQLSFWDAMIVASVIQSGCQTLWSGI